MRTLTLSIPDISCGHCAMTVKEALAGLGDCTVDIPAKRARLALADEAVLPEALRRLEAEGFPATVLEG